MTCKKAAYWLQLYIDSRLDYSRLALLEKHLRSCATCREDLVVLELIRDGANGSELVAEPADLTERILARIAAHEAERAAEWLPGVPSWAQSWRSAVVAIVVLMGLALFIEPGAWARISSTLASHAMNAYTLLLLPGPDSISWAIWAGGIVAALGLTVWFIRADASSSWRRAIAQRLPQLW